MNSTINMENLGSGFGVLAAVLLTSLPPLYIAVNWMDVIRRAARPQGA